jgi:hypothetical protein
MVCITSIAAHDGGRIERLGLRRAVLTRRANLGDCHDAASVLRRLASPRSMRHPACVIPLPRTARGEASCADLAVRVAQDAVRRRPGFDPLSVGALIYVHATPDARTTDSTAGRLQFDLELRRACAFSVSQAHNTAALIALDMAAGFIEGPEAADAALLVVSDKLLFRKPPHPPHDMVWCDVAAAALLEREADTGWRVDAIRLHHFAPACAPADRSSPHGPAVAQAAQALSQGLCAAGVAPEALAAVVVSSGDARFVEQVHRAAAIDKPGPRGDGSGLRTRHTACADLLAGLAALEPAVKPGRPVLAWTHGNNGEFACVVMTRAG